MIHEIDLLLFSFQAPHEGLYSHFLSSGGVSVSHVTTEKTTTRVIFSIFLQHSRSKDSDRYRLFQNVHANCVTYVSDWRQLRHNGRGVGAWQAKATDIRMDDGTELHTENNKDTPLISGPKGLKRQKKLANPPRLRRRIDEKTIRWGNKSTQFNWTITNN